MTYRKRVMVKALTSRSEAEIDDNLEDTFPASNPPSWTLGSDHRPADNQEREDDVGLKQDTMLAGKEEA